MTPRYSSLEYGLLWAVAFVLLGAHYWKRAGEGDEGA